MSTISDCPLYPKCTVYGKDISGPADGGGGCKSSMWEVVLGAEALRGNHPIEVSDLVG